MIFDTFYYKPSIILLFNSCDNITLLWDKGWLKMKFG